MNGFHIILINRYFHRRNDIIFKLNSREILNLCNFLTESLLHEDFFPMTQNTVMKVILEGYFVSKNFISD